MWVGDLLTLEGFAFRLCIHYPEHGLHVGAQHMHAEEAGVCRPLSASQSGSADISSHHASQRYGM